MIFVRLILRADGLLLGFTCHVIWSTTYTNLDQLTFSVETITILLLWPNELNYNLPTFDFSYFIVIPINNISIIDKKLKRNKNCGDKLGTNL